MLLAEPAQIKGMEFSRVYLLGLEGVRNYDGSWTEWGNLVGAPIER